MTTVTDIVTGLGGKRAGREWFARCPAHSERTPSLAIGEGDGGKVLVKCHAGCSQDSVIDALRRLGLWDGEARELTEADLAAMRQAAAEREQEAVEKQDRAVRIWRSSVPVIAPKISRTRDCTMWQGNVATIDAAIWRGAAADKLPEIESRAYSTPAEPYLRNRSIEPDLSLYESGYPATLGWCADAMGDPLSKPRGALVAAVSDDAGAVVAIQRIFLDEDGKAARTRDGKKAKFSLGPISGHAWQTDMHGCGPDPEGRWGLAEGVESALAAAQLFRIPVWAAISAPNMQHVTPPIWARNVWVFADNDKSSTGYKAALATVMRLWANPQIKHARIWMSPTPGYDVADHLMEATPYVVA